MAKAKPAKSSVKVRPDPRVIGEIPSPPYTINYAALQLGARLAEQPKFKLVETLAFLQERINDPTFHLEFVCRACEQWVPSKMKPERKGAIDNLQGCHGCVYSLLDGAEGGERKVRPADIDRDAAYQGWAEARRLIARLEQDKAGTRNPEKREKIEGQLHRAFEALRRAFKKCQRLGFSPSVAMRPQAEWEPPTGPITRAERREMQERRTPDPVNPAPSPSCRNCWSWEPDPDLSKREGRSLGRCWVADSEVTRADHWCHDHSLRVDEEPEEED